MSEIHANNVHICDDSSLIIIMRLDHRKSNKK